MFTSLATLVGAFTLSLLLTGVVRRVALARAVVDVPEAPRKLHSASTPLLGGLAIYLAFTAVVWVLALVPHALLGKDVSLGAVLALTLAGASLMLGGYLDDRYRLTPRRQLVTPTVAILLTLAAGIHVQVLSNPFGGGLIQLSAAVAEVLTVLWLLGMMYTTKLLDGLDGLATGIGAIGSLIIFGLTQFTPFYQPSVGLLSLALAGAALGFLVWNWYPAKIFLGEGGSLYLGFMLGVLSIISGAKIATALLVMGIPILDVAWVIVRRIFWDNKSLASADRKHLHYRLLDVGLTQRQAVVLLYGITAGFGITSLFLGTKGKVLALITAALVMFVLGVALVVLYKKKRAPHS